MQRSGSALALIALALVGWSFSPVGAQQEQQASPEEMARLDAIRAELRTGSVADDLVSAFDPEQRFAIYLPTNYTHEREWPLLVLMDPRGRAMTPMSRFVDIAERRGYVVVSSYNTASDTAEDVNTPAMRAMLVDLSRLVALDPRRFYLSGLSGTARAAWGFADQLGETVAGIIGFGAGEHEQYGATPSSTAVFYGAAGVTDFNYEEMRALEAKMVRVGMPHRYEFFPGGHTWGGADVAARAVDWMELQAMHRGLKPADPALVQEIFDGRMAVAEAMDAHDVGAPEGTGGEPAGYAAWRLYAAIAEDFNGLVDDTALIPVRVRVAELEITDEVQATIALHEELSQEHEAFTAQFRQFLAAVYAGEQDLAVEAMAARLGLAELKTRTVEADNAVEAVAAQRLLELANVGVGAYEADRFLASGQPVEAIAMLELSAYILDDRFRGWIDLAKAHAAAGHAAETVATLERAADMFDEGLDPDILTNDRAYEPVRATPEFQALLERIRR